MTRLESIAMAAYKAGAGFSIEGDSVGVIGVLTIPAVATAVNELAQAGSSGVYAIKTLSAKFEKVRLAMMYPNAYTKAEKVDISITAGELGIEIEWKRISLN